MVEQNLSPLCTKLSAFAHLSSIEINALNTLCTSARTYEPNTMLMNEGQPDHQVFVLLEGWAYTFRQLIDGRRQIIHFAIPGDFIGARNVALPRWSNSGFTLTSAKIAQIPQTNFLNIIRTRPALGMALLAALSRDEAIVVEHLVSIGRRSAIERTSYLFMELICRLTQIGIGGKNEFPCPITQEELGDALGLSAIHVNRVLRQLRERRIACLSKRQLFVRDIKALADIAGFDAEQYVPAFKADTLQTQS